jgi:hypothetical protein
MHPARKSPYPNPQQIGKEIDMQSKDTVGQRKSVTRTVGKGPVNENCLKLAHATVHWYIGNLFAVFPLSLFGSPLSHVFIYIKSQNTDSSVKSKKPFPPQDCRNFRNYILLGPYFINYPLRESSMPPPPTE